MLTSVSALVSAACLIGPAFGRISNFTFPTTAYLGETLKVNVTEENYIQQWYDLGVLFGFQSEEYACGTCVGQQAWYENL